MMKKIIVFLFAFFISAPAMALEYFDGLYDGYQVVYSPSSNSFSPGGMVDDRIVLTKKTTPGSGSYSVYTHNNKLVLALGSNFEFLINGRMIACHNADLTFYEVKYKSGKFFEQKMTTSEVAALFPSVKIIKISDFKNGKLNVRKTPFVDLTVLLLNDTSSDFYKYSFDPKDVKTTDIAGLITISTYGKITFSHYGDKPKLTINPVLLF